MIIIHWINYATSWTLYLWGNRSIEAKALVDSGTTTNFIHWNLVKWHKIPMEQLPQDIVVQNVNNTQNSLGSIHHKVYLAMKINGHLEVTWFLITNIRTDEIILGHTWLWKHNPTINWRKSLLQFIKCPPSCSLSLSWKWIDWKHLKAAIKVQWRTWPNLSDMTPWDIDNMISGLKSHLNPEMIMLLNNISEQCWQRANK